jgi:lycopene beta-cyclase
MTARRFDYLIAGGGLAGLSLACHLVHSPLRHRSILILERDPGHVDNRIWGFWTDRPGLFDPAIERAWHRLHISTPNCDRTLDLGRYRYAAVRGADLHAFACRELAAFGNVSWLQGDVQHIEDSPAGASALVDGQTFEADWAFDNRFRRADAIPVGSDGCLSMRFRGWEIAASRPAFDVSTVSFLDFRTPHKNDIRFFYVLPFSKNRAMVEYTLFSTARLDRWEGETALRDYLRRVWSLDDYTVLRQEAGSLPLTRRVFPRRLGQRVMSIGLKGGRMKPTTGFAYQRIQRDSEAIVKSLLRTGTPWHVPDSPGRYRLYDAVMLEVMEQQGEAIQSVFGALFRRNPIERVFAFLDECAAPWQDAQLIATLPPSLFVPYLFKMAQSAWGRRLTGAVGLRL